MFFLQNNLRYIERRKKWEIQIIHIMNILHHYKQHKNGIGMLESAKAIQAQERYQRRGFSNSGIEQGEAIKLANMDKESFESLRAYQMGQLYNAYLDLHVGRRIGSMGLRSTGDTSIDSVRRVTGNQPRYIYNNGILALSSEDIQVINQIAEKQSRCPDYTYTRQSFFGLEKIVDETLAAHKVMCEQFQVQEFEVPLNKIMRETDVLERAIGKNQMGKNIFDIRDFSNCAAQSRTGIVSKAMNKLGRFIGKKLNPEKYEKLGNKTLDEDPRL